MQPNTRHRVLVVGVGSIGERQLRCFQKTGRAAVMFCEPQASLREQVAERCGVADAFADLGDALAARPTIGIICTPAPLHIPLALRLAAAGADLLIEKPLSTSQAGVAELRTLATTKSLLVAVGYTLRAHAAVRAMKRVLDENRFGRPLQIVATSGQHFPTYRPAYRDTYYRQHATGGGAIQDAMTHLLNLGEHFVGPVDRLVADAEHQALEGVTVEDTVHVLTRHGSVLGSYSLNQYQAPNELTVTVVCERGTARFESAAARWQWLTEPGGTWQTETVGPVDRDTNFINQAEHFLDAVEQRGAPLCSLDEGARSLAVNLAVLESVRDHQWQTVEKAVG